MIVTGKYVYKKYKKRKQAKEDLLAADSAHHDEMVNAIQDPSLPTLMTGDASNPTPASYQAHPPPYSDVEQAMFAQTQPQYAPFSPPHPPPSPLSPSTLSPSSPSPYLHQQQSLAPTEIAVRGRWVWQPDTPQIPTPVATDSSYMVSLPGQPLKHQAVELEHERAPAELAIGKTFAFEKEVENGPVELPADLPSSDDSSDGEDRSTTTRPDMEKRAQSDPPYAMSSKLDQYGPLRGF
ncbi:hypothetical protein BU16DRAFT_532169 [Lophium mytilinum]|uniref:Uncharacterized protein n=1 Tax=Lophium mytilinum TaxID=390894 RepID=A0A6A6Q9N2_9PEZI|nr:hypothetical protein BU16DRAFT_532169 [Lophium mytilinum]